jgi:hypothetical protein
VQEFAAILASMIELRDNLQDENEKLSAQYEPISSFDSIDMRACFMIVYVIDLFYN